MNMVTTSQGPQVSYMRTKTTVESSERDLTIGSDALVMGHDYVAVANHRAGTLEAFTLDRKG